jgi:signal transduction histidine kinase
LFAHALWLSCVCLLGSWWGWLIFKQSARIAELEARLASTLGFQVIAAETHWHKTQRMILWESASFFVLLLMMSGVLIWLYWRDFKRTRGVQAFFAGVTHELRTPLTSIRLQTEMIAENFTKESPEWPLIERLLEDTARLESQVERTLELARLEGGGPVFIQDLDIQPWIGRILSDWQEAHRGRMLVQSELQQTTPVQADRGAVQVVLRNILENSLRHSRREPVSIRLTAEDLGDSLVLKFKDDGSGFPGKAAELGQIFLKGEGSQGAGVGLYLIQALMKKMGGWAEFSGDQGFEVALGFKKAQMGGQSHG